MLNLFILDIVWSMTTLALDRALLNLFCLGASLALLVPHSPPLEGYDRLELREVSLDAVVAQVDTRPHTLWELRPVALEDIVVVPPAPSVVGPLQDQALPVHSQLGLDRVPLPLARVVALPLPAVLWTRNLLLRGIYEGP